MFRSLVILELVLLSFSAGITRLEAEPTSQNLRFQQFRLAVTEGDLGAVQQFVHAGWPLNNLDEAGGTLLTTAIIANQAQIADYLLVHGADPNLRQGPNGAAALRYAVAADRPELIRILLSHGANPNLPFTDNDTTLHLAARRATAATVGELCSAGANKEALNLAGNTPLDEAVLHGNVVAVAALLSSGADPRRVRKSDGRGPIHEACVKGYPALLPLLTSAGADPVSEDRSGQTPLDLALDYGNEGAVKCLRQMAATTRSLEANFEAAMERAVLRGQTARVALLLDAGFPADSATPGGSHFLNEAAFKGRLNVVRLLLDHGASTELRNEAGGTVLHDAATAGDPGIIALLLDRKAAINARETRTGATPLMLAASMGRVAAVSLLLARSADRLLRDAAGRSALDRARAVGNSEVFKLLSQRDPVAFRDKSFDSHRAATATLLLGEPAALTRE